MSTSWFQPLAWDASMAFIHLADGRLTARSREVTKPRDSGLDFSNRSAIRRAHRQQSCRYACQISEQYDHYNIQSRGSETSWELAVKCHTDSWIEALNAEINAWRKSRSRSQSRGNSNSHKTILFPGICFILSSQIKNVHRVRSACEQNCFFYSSYITTATSPKCK